VAVAIALWDMLQDNPPKPFHIDSPGDLGIVHCRGTEVALGSNPVRGIVWAGALGGPGVIPIVKASLLGSSNVLHQIICRLVSDVCVLLQEERVLGDLCSYVIGRVLGVRDTKREI